MRFLLMRGALAAALCAVAPRAAAAAEGALAPASHAAPSADGEALAREADLDAVLAAALEHNPDLREADRRVVAAGERARVAGGLPDPQLRYQLWSAPLATPLTPDMHMLGVTQELPAPGSRAARVAAGECEAALRRQVRRARAEQIATEVRRAFAEYHQADRQRRIRLEHLELTRHIVDLARANYQAGRASQQDVLRACVEQSRLTTDLADVEQQRRSAQARLNALMGRDADAPLGPPRELHAPSGEPLPPPPPTAAAAPAAPAAAEGIAARRPEVLAATKAVERSQAELRALDREARLPAFMLGVDYMYAPMAEEKNRYSAMVGISLPWLNGRHDSALREARATLAADEAGLQSTRVAAGYQLADAQARCAAARKTYESLDGDQLQLARRSFEAAQAGFAAGQTDALGVLDAERSWLQVRLERERALAQWIISRADLDRAAGTATAGLAAAGTEAN